MQQQKGKDNDEMIKLNPIFCDNMIMQAGKPVRVFGTGAGTVKITLDNETKSVQADGKWLVEFPQKPYGGPYTITVTTEDNAQIIKDIYFGDVYFLGGQSNMQLKLAQTNYPAENFAGNDFVRLYTVDRLEDEEHYHAKDGWVALTKDSAQYFSALGYHIAQAQATSERRIGLIACYQGASVIQTWLPKQVAEREEFIEAKPLHSLSLYPLWNGDGCLFEYQTSTILPYSISTVIYYQGEANAMEGVKYYELLKALVESWREAFIDEKLKLVIIQLANLKGFEGEQGWKRVQADQLRAGETLDGVKTVISKDVCEDDDIHPPTKTLLAKRIVEAL